MLEIINLICWGVILGLSVRRFVSAESSWTERQHEGAQVAASAAGIFFALVMVL